MSVHNDYGDTEWLRTSPLGLKVAIPPQTLYFHKFSVKFTNIQPSFLIQHDLPPSNIDMIHAMSVQIKFSDNLTAIS